VVKKVMSDAQVSHNTFSDKQQIISGMTTKYADD
jgi:hypothetical protein